MRTSDKVGEDYEDTYYINNDITWTQFGDI